MDIYINEINYDYLDVSTKDKSGYEIGYTNCSYTVYFGNLKMKGYTGFIGELDRKQLIDNIKWIIENSPQ